jgi:hypothetical protein
MKSKYLLLPVLLYLCLRLYSQTANAQSWQRITTLDSSQSNSIYELTHTPMSLIVGTQGAFLGRDSVNRMFVSSDFGNRWREGVQQTNGGNTLPFHTLFISPTFAANRLFCIDALYGTLKTSIDSGRTWQTIDIQLRDFTSGIPMNFILGVGNTLFAIKSGPIVSRDTGKTFRLVGSLPSDTFGFRYLENILWAITRVGLYSSSDTGKTWIKVSEQREQGLGSVVPITKSVFFAQYFRYSANTTLYTRYISFNAGASWQPWNVIPEREYVGPSVIWGKLIYLYTTIGLFSSSDQGITWVKESGKNGLPEGPVRGITISGNTLFVAVFERGLFSLNLTTVSTREEPPLLTFHSSPAPNPTSETAAIAFTLPHPAQVALTLFSALGVEVWRSVSASYAAGEQHITVDTRGLPSGVYSYRLTAGGMHSVGRVVVVR